MVKRNNNQVVKLNESQLKLLIKDSIKKTLKEDFSTARPENKFNATKPSYWKDNHGYDDEKANKASDWMSRHYGDLEEDYNDLYDDEENGEEQDDWRSEEPSENDVTSILQQIQEKCNGCGATFKDLGENEFGVISRNGNCHEIENLLQMLEGNGVIYNTGGKVSTNGPWHAKFRVIKAFNEINESSLNRIIIESVKKVLKESWRDKDKTNSEKKKYRDERNGTLRHFKHKTDRGVKNGEKIENQRKFLKSQTDINKPVSKRLKEPDKWTEKFLKNLDEQAIRKIVRGNIKKVLKK